MPAGTLASDLATPPGIGRDSRAAGSDCTLTRTEAGSANAGDATDPRATHTPVRSLSPSASSSTSAILPGGTQLSSVESGRRAFFRSLAQIGRQVAGGLAYAHARGIRASAVRGRGGSSVLIRSISLSRSDDSKPGCSVSSS